MNEGGGNDCDAAPLGIRAAAASDGKVKVLKACKVEAYCLTHLPKLPNAWYECNLINEM